MGLNQGARWAGRPCSAHSPHIGVSHSLFLSLSFHSGSRLSTRENLTCCRNPKCHLGQSCPLRHRQQACLQPRLHPQPLPWPWSHAGLAGLPGSIHVVVLPLDIDPHWLINPLLLWRKGVDFVGLAVVRTPGGGHVGLGEMGRAVRGVEEGLVVAHHRESLLEGREGERKPSVTPSSVPLLTCSASQLAGRPRPLL